MTHPASETPKIIDLPDNASPSLPKYANAAEMHLAEVRKITAIVRDSIVAPERARYPETRFRKYFAPFFLGVYQAPKEYNLITMWVSEVGSQHVEVDIIDSEGNVVFVVPPVLNSGGLDLSSNANALIRIRGLEQQSEAEARNNPSQAHVGYMNGLSEKLNSMFSNYSVDPSYYDKWARIYAYYNVPDPRAKPNTGPTQSVAAAESANKWGDVGQLDFE